MNIGLFAPRHNPQAIRLAEQINALAPGNCHLFYTALLGEEVIAMDSGKILWDGIEIDRLERAYLHGFRHMDPLVPSSADGLDWGFWQSGYIADQQRYSILYSICTELQRRGVELINPPSSHLLNFTKGEQLERLRRTGVQVPELLCSNDREQVNEFTNRCGTALWRPATGRAAWQLFTPRQRDALVGPTKPPTLLAQLIDGPLLWAYQFGEETALVHGYSPAQTTPIEMLESFKAVPKADYSDQSGELTKCTDAKWRRIQFILHEGTPWIYDLDPDPLLAHLPLSFQNHLINYLAHRLLGRASPPPPPELFAHGHQRPTLYLRRMLQILFDIEVTKYPTAEPDKGESK